VSGLYGKMSPYLYGDVSGLRGEVSQYLRGDVSGLRGDVTGLSGDVPPRQYGNVDDCELTDRERKAGVKISDLIAHNEKSKQ